MELVGGGGDWELGALWEMCKWQIRDFYRTPVNCLKCGLPWTRSQVWNSVASFLASLFEEKCKECFFFSVSVVAFSVECLILLYRLYAESIVTAWRSDPPLVFSVLLLLLLLLWKRAGVRKWRHYFILLANILLPRAVFGIYFTYFRTGISRSVERRILGIILCIPIEIKPS